LAWALWLDYRAGSIMGVLRNLRTPGGAVDGRG
jgi:hypothetical protein